MPIAKVQMPDGRVARFEVPEGTTPDQVVAFAQSMQQPAPPQNFLQRAQAAGEAQGGEFLGEIGGREVAARAAAGQGLLDVGQGMKQLAMRAGEGMGLLDAGRAQDYTRQVEAERAAYEQQPFAQDPRNKLSRFVGQAVPAAIVPGGVAGGLGARVLSGAAAGGGIGAAQFVPEGESRAQNTMVGAAMGGVMPPLVAAARAGGAKIADIARPLFSKEPTVGAGQAQALVGEGLPEMAEKRLADANLLGVQLTPGEATGSNILARAQGRVGRSDAGSEILSEAGQARTRQESSAISNLLGEIEPTGRPGAAGVRAAASGALKAKQKLLSDKARPLYKAARNALIPEEQLAPLLDDPVIAGAMERVMKKPAFQKELKGLPQNSVGFMDVVKRDLFDQASTLDRSGAASEARIIKDSWDSVSSALKASSDDYSAAVALYAPEARTIQQLKESAVGRISGLKEGQLKSVSRVVFDPQQTNVNELRGLRDMIHSKDPESWNRIVRNELERRLDMVKGERTGSAFYNQILAKERDFKMFDNALSKNPLARRKLRAMRNAFKDLIGMDTAKGAAGRAQANLDAPRSALQLAIDLANKFAGGQHDKAAARFLTSPDWDSQFRVIMRTARGRAAKTRRLAGLMSRISAQQATIPSGEEEGI